MKPTPACRTSATPLAIAVGLLLCMGGAPVRAQTPAAQSPPAFVGAWSGPGLDKVQAPGGAEAYIRRSLVFTPDRETLRVEAFADPAAAVRLFTYASEGPYRLIGPSAVVAGAYEVDLVNERSSMTIHVADAGLWKALNLGACPLEVGKPVEISGCVSGPPFNASTCVDRDLVHVDAAGALRFGDQTVDRCVTRPDRLDRAHYVRTPG